MEKRLRIVHRGVKAVLPSLGKHPPEGRKRCPECGGMVEMPCYGCLVKKMVARSPAQRTKAILKQRRA
jgi:hypothetical protein